MQSERQHLMPILVRNDHLLHNLLYVLICRLNSTVHLRAVRGRIVMLNVEVLAQLLHHFVVEIRTIISNDSFGNPIATNDFFLDETGNHMSGDIRERRCFDPLGEIVDGNKDEAMPIKSSRLNLSNHVNAPHGKRPRRRHHIQRIRRYMHLISINLAFMTLPSILETKQGKAERLTEKEKEQATKYYTKSPYYSNIDSYFINQFIKHKQFINNNIN